MSEFSTHGASTPDTQAALNNLMDTVDAQLDDIAARRTHEDAFALTPVDVTFVRSQWRGQAPALPDNLAVLLPAIDHAAISASYRRGGHSSDIELSISRPDAEEDELAVFSISQKFNPDTGELLENTGYAHSAAGSITVGKQDVRSVMDALLRDNPRYVDSKGMSITDAFRSGIEHQPDAEIMALETAQKRPPLAYYALGNSHITGLFKLHARAVNRRFHGGDPSITELTLHQVIDGAGVVRILERKLEVARATGGKIIDATRRSDISIHQLVKNPQPENPNTIPDPQLYPDAKPTIADVALFQHLITQPLTQSDIVIGKNY